jgi:redox-sensitive bicupin YhaK (pirin superfamily)
MEIVSYVISGELSHQDNRGGRGADTDAATLVIRPGDVQRMSAGRGVMHSEFNHAPGQVTHFLQIWIEPNVRGIDASYEQKRFDDEAKRSRLCLVASPDGRDGSVTLHADASLYAGLFDGDAAVQRALDPRRKTYVHVVRGAVRVNEQVLHGGDALRLQDESLLTIDHGEDAEVLVFDLQ